jgi:Lar family restriction alleviation protein
MSELKPCPFCGRNKYLEAQYEKGDHSVYCNYCGATGSFRVGDNSELDLWNTRPIEDALRAENRRLNRALILSRTVIDAVARETNKDFTAINAMIDEALKDGE